MPVQVLMPPNRRRDIFDVITSGLQAAKAFTDVQKARAELQAMPALQLKQKKTDEFALDEKEAAFQKTFIEVPKGTQGSVILKTPKGVSSTFIPREQYDSRKKQKFEMLGKVQENILSNPDFKEARSKVLTTEQFIELGRLAIDEGSQQAFKYMRILIASGAMKGVLSDNDLDQFGGADGLVDKLNRSANKIAGGVTVEDVEDLLDIAKTNTEQSLRNIESLRGDEIRRSLKRFQLAGYQEITLKDLEEITDINNLMEQGLTKYPERKTKRSRRIGTSSKSQNEEQMPSTRLPEGKAFDIDEYLGGQ